MRKTGANLYTYLQIRIYFNPINNQIGMRFFTLYRITDNVIEYKKRAFVGFADKSSFHAHYE